MSDNRYFALKSEHGIDHADNLEPIVSFGLGVAVPVIGADGELHEITHVVHIQPAGSLEGQPGARVIPDTRIVEVCNVAVAAAIVDMKLFDEVDEPKKGDLDRAHKETAAHVDAMKNRGKLVAAGDLPAPDADDPVPTTEPAGDGQEG